MKGSKKFDKSSTVDYFAKERKLLAKIKKTWRRDITTHGQDELRAREAEAGLRSAVREQMWSVNRSVSFRLFYRLYPMADTVSNARTRVLKVYIKCVCTVHTRARNPYLIYWRDNYVDSRSHCGLEYIRIVLYATAEFVSKRIVDLRRWLISVS